MENIVFPIGTKLDYVVPITNLDINDYDFTFTAKASPKSIIEVYTVPVEKNIEDNFIIIKFNNNCFFNRFDKLTRERLFDYVLFATENNTEDRNSFLYRFGRLILFE